MSTRKPNETDTLTEGKAGIDELMGLPSTGYLRLNAILKPNGPLALSKSTWWKGIKEERFPAPVKLSPRVSAWKARDILELIKNIEKGGRHD